MAGVVPVAATTVVSCGVGGGKYYAKTVGATSNTQGGTAVATTTPAHWSVYEPDTDDDWAEEAFIVGPVVNGRQTAIEAGMFSGWWPYNPYDPFFTGLLPYYTINDGDGTGQDFDSAAPIPPNTALGLYSWSAGVNTTAAFAHVGGTAFDLGLYTVQSPRTNVGQGEINGSSATWMGGGSGEVHHGHWSPDAVNWPSWTGYTYACVDAPYWLTLNNQSEQWTDGGY